MLANSSKARASLEIPICLCSTCGSVANVSKPPEKHISKPSKKRKKRTKSAINKAVSILGSLNGEKSVIVSAE